LAETDSNVTVDVQEPQPEEEIRVCLFNIGEDLYAIPVEQLTEIIIPQKIFPVPTTPPLVLGIINLRGNIIPIIDIRQMLSSSEQASSIGYIAVVKYGMMTIGFVVDSVTEVASVPISSILTIPADYRGQAGMNRSRFFKGIIQREAGLAALLNVDRIFEEIKVA